MAYSSQSNPTSQQQPFQRQQQAPQAQQQASPYKAPDMSAYAQPGYNAYNVPRTAPKGAQQNDLSGNVPSNQIFAQAYNQASRQYGGNTQAQSFTMPGSFTSQGYNPTTGQYGPMTGGKSFDGNMAYNAINSRPSPVTATSTFAGGQPMDFQQNLNQREAFAGNLSQRLGQYSSGQLTGPVTIDQGQLMAQADDQLAKGTFFNPFSQNPDVQRAMGNASQYMQGDFQNPFGNSPQANNPQPSWDQRSYDPSAPQQSDPKSRSPATWSDADLQAANQAAQAEAERLGSMGIMDSGVRYYRDPATGKVLSDSQSGQGKDAAANWDATQEWQSRQPARVPIYSSQSPPAPTPNPQPPRTAPNGPGSAQPIAPPSQGTTYSPQAGAQSLPSVPAPPSYGEDPIAARKKAAKQQGQSDSDLQSMRDRWLNGATTGQSYKQRLGGKNFKDLTPDQMADEYTGELWKRVNDGRLSQADYDKAVAGMDTDLNQSKSKQSKLQQIDNEINQWQRATYGTRQGNGPPPEWSSHIQALQRLRTKAVAGDPAALAWNPKMKAPAANVSPNVPLSGRGSAARFGPMRRNGG